MLRTPDGLCCDRGNSSLIGVAGLRRGGIAVVPGVPLAAARWALQLPLHVGEVGQRPGEGTAEATPAPVNASICWGICVVPSLFRCHTSRWPTTMARAA